MAQQPPMQQPDALTPQAIQQGIFQMKKALSQIEGECATMRGDAQSKIFENMAAVCGRLIQQTESLKQGNKQFSETLAEIYQAHPEIKVAMDKKPKPKKPEVPTIKIPGKKP